MSILNGNETFNIAEFDALVLDALSPSSPSKSQSEKALMQFKDSPSSIALIDTILRNSKQKESILFALMTLDEAVRTRWLAFSDEQRAGMKAYFISLIVGSCGGDDIVLKKLDQILIQVLKKEWPDRWPGFIDEIIAASQSQIDICANTLVIFRLLHDQVASENYELVESMTTIKKIKISRQLRLEIPKILDFIQRILQSDAKDQLLKPSLQCLRSIFEEIDEDFLFGSEIIEIILYHISQAPVEVFECLLVISKYKIRGAIFNSQNEEIDSKTCSCLSEELCYHPKQAPENMKSEKLNLIHRTTIQFLNIYFEGKDDLPTVYPTLVAEERQFIKTFSHFLANFYKKKLMIFDPEILIFGINHLLEISKVDDDEIFKAVLNFWTYLLSALNEFRDDFNGGRNKSCNNSGDVEIKIQTISRLLKNRYIIEKLLNIFVYKMPRPVEILVIENEYGEIVKQKMTDTDMIAFIDQMKEGLNLICRLIPNEAHKFLLHDLKKDNNIDNLNRVGWAIGSITFSKIGNRADEDEFFIAALKSLLQTCNIKTEKNDKAIVASLIIFLISQFTNFFEKNKKFFLTVIHKIFEFMDEEHEGIKDMACEAFENICRKRPREFYVARKESEIFIFYMLRNLSNITRNLELYQKRSVFKSICCVIQNKAEVLNFQFRHRDTNNPGEEQENLRMAREINFLNTYLTKMGVSQNSSVKAYSHYFKTCEILYSTFPNSLINNASNFGNEESITPNFSYDSLKNIEAGNTECQYKYSVENKIIIPPVFNLYGIIKNTNYDQCLRADMIECFISIIRSIPKINSVATQLKNEFMKSCFIASLGVASDFPATKEFLLLDLVTEMVKISFSLEFMKSPIEKNCLYSNNENERANQALNDFHCEDNYRVLDDFILKNILPQIDDIADVDFAYSYLNLMISIFDNRYDMFFPLFSADEELFEKCYNHILSALLMKENIREKATELLIIICRKSYQTKNYLFFKKFYFTTLDNIFGIIFENHYKSATELLTILLSYRHTLEPVLGISVDKHIGELISSFSNVPGDYQTTFREGLFLLLGNDQLFSDHVSDFRKRVQIIENCDEIDDEKRLLEMRTRCCSQNKLNIGKFQ